jgi:predicted PurR-regulated permease PerM
MNGEPSAGAIARLVAIVALCVGALYLLYIARGVIELIVLAVFTATALGPLVSAVERTRLPRAWAILVVYVTGALAIAGTAALVAPSVGAQVAQLSHDAQRKIGDLRGRPVVRRYDDRYHLTEKVQAQLRGLPAHLDEAAGPLRDVTVGAVGLVSDAIAVLSIAFLLILHGRRYVDGLLSLLPAERAARWQRLTPQIYSAVSGYVIGNAAISVIAGTGAWLAMTALGVPFALPLALLVAFLDLIPMVGATLGSIIVALAALVVSPLAAVLWLAYSFLYQQVENYLIQPVDYRRSVQVSALATIVAVLLGGALLGLLGALLAIPTAAAVQLVVQDIRREASDTAVG